MDVFSSSVRRIGPLAKKITVVNRHERPGAGGRGWIAGPGVARVGAAEKAETRKAGSAGHRCSQEGWAFIHHDLFLVERPYSEGDPRRHRRRVA